MPTPPKNSTNMRKHLTKSEIDSRKRAEEGMRRKKRVTLRVPKWLDEKAREVWRDLRKRLRGLELLDNVDAEMLGIYCDAIAKYRAASQALSQVDAEGLPVATDEMIKATQAWARLVATYAEKLGLSPQARARLAMRKAKQEPPDEMESLLDEVREFVNDDRSEGQ